MRLRAVVLIVSLALAVLAAPLDAEAQPAGKVYRIGLLFVGDPATVTSGTRLPRPFLKGPLGPFVEGLENLGWIEGRNIVFELRRDSWEKLPELAAELVRVPVDIILVVSAAVAAMARKATATIPIVVLAAGELEGTGLVASLARPGGNVTGMQVFSPELIGKQLEVLREVVPALARVGVLVGTVPSAEAAAIAARFREQTEAAGRALGFEPTYVTVERVPEELEAAFNSFVARRADAVLVYAGPLMFVHRRRVAELALRHRLPSAFDTREYVDEGGLLSYGVSLPEVFRRGAVFVDKILKGAKPADLPVEQPTKFELVVNLKTAKALGLTIPPSVMIRADRIIE